MDFNDSRKDAAIKKQLIKMLSAIRSLAAGNALRGEAERVRSIFFLATTRFAAGVRNEFSVVEGVLFV